MTEEKKDVIVVAREGYSVLLNVGSQTLDINCYKHVNLSSMFSHDTLANCSSLRAHLEDGNLVYYVGQPLPKDPYAPHIKPMREVAATRIETTYTQEDSTAAAHMQVKTTADEITSDMKKDIQARVASSREEVLAQDKKILDKSKAPNVVDSRPKERETAMTKEELTMKVEMDISPEEFKKRQIAARKKLQEQDQADHDRAAQEIAEQEQLDSEI